MWCWMSGRRAFVDPALLRQVRLGTPHIAGYSHDGKLLATRMLVAAMARELGLDWRDPGSAAGAAATAAGFGPQCGGTGTCNSFPALRYCRR